MELHIRKHPRLKGYDYSHNGAYFVTICTKDKACILSRVVGRGLAPAETVLTEMGVLIERQILDLQERYPFLTIVKYVIMPNHLHAILQFDGEKVGASTVEASAAGASPRPTLSDVICAFKSLATHSAGQKIWQTSFHDHIIRDENDLLTHWRYIEDNPLRWADDDYYIE